MSANLLGGLHLHCHADVVSSSCCTRLTERRRSSRSALARATWKPWGPPTTRASLVSHFAAGSKPKLVTALPHKIVYSSLPQPLNPPPVCGACPYTMNFGHVVARRRRSYTLRCCGGSSQPQQQLHQQRACSPPVVQEPQLHSERPLTENSSVLISIQIRSWVPILIKSIFTTSCASFGALISSYNQAQKALVLLQTHCWYNYLKGCEYNSLRC